MSTKLTFSNGETLIVHEDQILIPIVRVVRDKDISASMGKPVEIWSHTHNGLIPSLLDLLFASEYFCLVDTQDKVYNSSAVVTIENL